MNNTGPFFPADAGQAVPAVVEQGVDQRPVAVAGGGVYHQARRFVDDDHIRVLIHHVQGNVLRDKIGLLRFRQRDGQGFPARQFIVFGYGFAVDLHGAALQQFLRGGAGHAVQMRCEEAVDARARILRCGGEVNRFHQSCAPFLSSGLLRFFLPSVFSYRNK